MKRCFMFAILILLVSVQCAQGLDTQTRPIGPVRTWTTAAMARFDAEWLQVKFIEGSNSHLAGSRFADDSGLNLADVNETVGRASVVEMRPTFDIVRATLRDWKARGEARRGTVGPDLSLWFNIRVEGGRAAVARLINELNNSPAVEIAHPVAIAQEAVILSGAARAEPKRSIRTPDFTDQQDYLFDTPVGLNAPAAWALPGGKGEQMKFIDVERCWFHQHEDFTAENLFYIGGYTPWPTDCDHGTAVVGEVVGTHNGFGVSGFAPEAEWGLEAYDSNLWPEVSEYFEEAAEALDQGDIWLIEIQMYPPGRDATPMEWLQSNYDAIWTSCWALEVVCVEAGANGSQNLDDPSWDGVFDRNVRDSGAIMVGAGTGYGRLAEYFTNYGSRMDVHAWGSEIVTTGYGDLYNGGTRETEYTAAFGGTSGASPMVVGAGLCLQGIAKAYLGFPLTPELLRAILHDTGIPHLDPTKEIGPRPDLAAAAEAVLAYAQAPFLAIEALSVDDDDIGESQGNGNGLAEYSETIELTLTLENLGALDAENVVGLLSTHDGHITITADTGAFGTISGGGGLATNAAPFVFAIASTVPDQHQVDFQLVVNAPPDTLDFSLVIGAPLVELVAFEVSDDVGGNGNGIPEPGEDVTLEITVANSGSAAVADVSGSLFGGPYMECDPSPAAFGALDPGAVATGGPFAISIYPECPNPFSALLWLTAQGSGDYTHTDIFSFNIGDLFAEDMEDGGLTWSHYPASAEYGDEWHIETYRNHTYGGTMSWKCGGPGADNYADNLYSLLESSPFTLPAGAMITFWHWIDAETSGSYPGYCYDGGRVEISLDGGAFEPITPAGGYPYLARPGGPLPEGTPLFSGTHDWDEVSFDLSGYAGSARIRFAFVSDGGVTHEGWYIDDVGLLLTFSDVSPSPQVGMLQLHPARPNPVHASTTLRLDLPRAAQAELHIYDPAGRRLRTLVNAMLPPGSHPIVWDGRDTAGNRAAGGVYWARGVVASEPVRRRIVLVR